jgi:nucleoside-diphosphate-sugar epimerase
MLNSVLITGGTGFVGHAMMATQPDYLQGVAVFQNKEHYQTRWEIGSWDAIIHLANISPARVLKYAQKHNTRVLYVSSGAVYNRRDDYSYHKRMWEAECRASEANVVIARPFCFVGPYLPDTFSIGQFIKDGIAGGPVRYYDIGCIRSYMWSEDMGRWLWKILLEGDNGVYDVGGARSVSMKQVAEIVARECRCKAVQGLEVESGKPKIYLPTLARAQELGCVETITLTEAVRRTVAWNRERMKE